MSTATVLQTKLISTFLHVSFHFPIFEKSQLRGYLFMHKVGSEAGGHLNEDSAIG